MPDWCHIHGYILQRTKVGPLHFITIINVMDLILPAVKYVDDTTSYESHNSPPPHGAKSCQRRANKANTWVTNPKKTVNFFIHFSLNPTPMLLMKLRYKR